MLLSLRLLKPQTQIVGELITALSEWSWVIWRRSMEIQAMTAIITLGKEIWLIFSNWVVNRSSLPWIIREIRVEDVVSIWEFTAKLLVHFNRGWEHLLSESFGTLSKMILQVDRLGSQATSFWSSVEVRYLTASLISPRT